MAAIDRFIPPPLRDDVSTLRRGRILVGSAFLLAIGFLVGTAARLAIGKIHPASAVVSVSSFAVFLAMPWLLRATGSLRITGLTTVASFSASIVGMVVLAGGLDAPLILILPLIPFVATYLLDSRAGILAAVLVSTAVVGLVFLQLGGVVLPPAPEGDDARRATALVLLFTIPTVAFIAVYNERQQMEAERRTKESEALYRVLRDVSEQEQAEAEREAMLAELAEKNTELERFTYTVSHDLKSPLLTIRGFVNLLRKDTDAGDRQRMEEDMSQISGATQSLRQMVDDLLEVSRIRRQSESWVEVSLGGVVRETLDLLAGRISAAGVEVEVEKALPRLRCDRILLRMVFQNLIDNAVKYSATQPAPRVTIGARRDASQPVYFVRDNGVGIAPEDQDRVFDLFRQLSPSESGTGIGLTSVKRAIEVHGGRIWVESDGVGQGSTFCFTLPERV